MSTEALEEVLEIVDPRISRLAAPQHIIPGRTLHCALTIGGFAANDIHSVEYEQKVYA